MRRVLFVAYYFPPLGGIGSLRISSFAAHLPSYGWAPMILAPNSGAYYRDPELAFPEALVVRTRSLELSRMGKRMLRTGGDDAHAAPVSGRLRGLARCAARSLIYFPDAHVGWYLPATLTALQRLGSAGFDVIYSSSVPVTAHLIARRLHRTWRIPWVAEFRDPWSQLLPSGSLARRRAARLEQALAREASGLVMTSPTWAEMHGRAWSRPVSVILNGHDGPIPERSPSRGSYVLTYLGTFYPAAQRLDAVWDAIRVMRNRGEETVDRLRFIGELPSALRQELSERRLSSIVEPTGFLSHAAATERLSASSALLLAGPREAHGLLRGHIAAKAVEYLATDLPIIYVGRLDCDIADLLRRYPGCHLVDVDDVESVVAALRASRGRRYARDVDSLSRQRLTGRLAQVLEEACSCAS